MTTRVIAYFSYLCYLFAFPYNFSCNEPHGQITSFLLLLIVQLCKSSSHLQLVFKLFIMINFILTKYKLTTTYYNLL